MVCKLTKEEKIKAYSMLLDGYSYKAIARELGVNREVIYHLFGNRRRNEYGPSFEVRERAIYPAIIRYLVRIKCNTDVFARKIHMAPLTFRRCLFGEKEFKKRNIDSILQEMGCTYDEAFETEETECVMR